MGRSLRSSPHFPRRGHFEEFGIKSRTSSIRPRPTVHGVGAGLASRELQWGRAIVAGLALAPAVVRIGWTDEALLVGPQFLQTLTGALLVVYAVILLAQVRTSGAGNAAAYLRDHLFELLTLGFAATVGSWWWPGLAMAAGLLVAFHMLRGYLALVETGKVPPGVLFVGSFIALIAVGTGLLMLPAATPVEKPIELTEAVFTVTSAISQTGLVVRSTGEDFTRFGQLVIIIWVQLGALGILVFGAVFALFLGSGFGIRATQTLAEGTEQGWSGQLSLARLVAFVIIFTHGVELVGAGVLYFGWPDGWAGAPEMATRGDRLFHAVFFSISGFCNAGFATTANSMQGLRLHWTTHTTLVGLIVLGSIGFPVLDNLRQVMWARVRNRRVEDGALVRLNLNTKLILATTVAVYLLGWLAIVMGETAQTEQAFSYAMADAHFMTVNRTSGFDTIPPSDMGLFSQLVLILLMFIGGSPGSVAGGIKMMVFAVLVLTVWSTIRGRAQTTAFGRTLPDELVRKSATLIVLSLATVMAVTGVLAATESARDLPLDYLLFESVSAFGTTGLSMGVTSELGTASRWAIIVAMFIGRVGPLAVMAALMAVARHGREHYQYPTENVVIY